MIEQLILNFTKSTKNTHRYDAPTDASPLQNLYIQKDFFKGDPPKQIVVEIKEKV